MCVSLFLRAKKQVSHYGRDRWLKHPWLWDDIQLELIINARYDRWCLGFLLTGTKSAELHEDVVVKNLHDCDTFYLLFISLKVKSLLPPTRMTSKAFINFQQIFFYLLRIWIYSRMKFIAAEWSVGMRDGRFERANSGPQRSVLGERDDWITSRRSEIPWRWINIY